MAKNVQTGGSQPGPAQLDTARRNRGIHEADVTIDAPDDEPWAARSTGEPESRRIEPAEPRSGGGSRSQEDADEDKNESDDQLDQMLNRR
jgi:hypothetical protein